MTPTNLSCQYEAEIDILIATGTYTTFNTAIMKRSMQFVDRE